jgi:hypothetical protein
MIIMIINNNDNNNIDLQSYGFSMPSCSRDWPPSETSEEKLESKVKRRWTMGWWLNPLKSGGRK